MGLRTEQIVKILQLSSLGRKTAFKLCEIAKEEIFDDDKDLQAFILECIENKKVLRLHMYSNAEFNTAFKKGDDLYERSQNAGIKMVSFFDEDFPKQLKEIEDSPIILNFKGDYKQLNNLSGIAIIGTREPTPEGVKSGEYFGKFCGDKGFNIVSGLAKGCDSAAHRGCLKGSGFTTAIVAHGLHMIYPKENMYLAEDILSKGGVLLSEYIIGTSALPNYFVERDRLQAGLSEATIVIQTAIKGGTMHAVDATLKSGKLLGAVRYKQNILSDKVKGNEMLIREKEAFPLTSENQEEFIEKIIQKSKLRIMADSLPNPVKDIIQVLSKNNIETVPVQESEEISKSELPILSESMPNPVKDIIPVLPKDKIETIADQVSEEISKSELTMVPDSLPDLVKDIIPVLSKDNTETIKEPEQPQQHKSSILHSYPELDKKKDENVERIKEINTEIAKINKILSKLGGSVDGQTTLSFELDASILLKINQLKNELNTFKIEKTNLVDENKQILKTVKNKK